MNPKEQDSLEKRQIIWMLVTILVASRQPALITNLEDKALGVFITFFFGLVIGMVANMLTATKDKSTNDQILVECVVNFILTSYTVRQVPEVQKIVDTAKLFYYSAGFVLLVTIITNLAFERSFLKWNTGYVIIRNLLLLFGIENCCIILLPQHENLLQIYRYLPILNFVTAIFSGSASVFLLVILAVQKKHLHTKGISVNTITFTQHCADDAEENEKNTDPNQQTYEFSWGKVVISSVFLKKVLKIEIVPTEGKVVCVYTANGSAIFSSFVKWEKQLAADAFYWTEDKKTLEIKSDQYNLIFNIKRLYANDCNQIERLVFTIQYQSPVALPVKRLQTNP